MSVCLSLPHSLTLFGQEQQMQLIALCLPPWDIIKDYRR